MLVSVTDNALSEHPRWSMSDFNNGMAIHIRREIVGLKVLLTLFLGSLGVSALLPIHHLMVRRRKEVGGRYTFHEDRMDPFEEVPAKVRIRPVRGDVVTCQICMGGLKAGLPFVRCECGKVFHIICLKRTGYCPYCERYYSPEQVEESATYPRREGIECPMCGRLVPEDMGRCECGAIFCDEDGRFYCPSCGTQIDGGEHTCPFCGERFEDVCLICCPFCGRLLEEGKGVCECGTFLAEACPDCGTHLSMDDRSCPSCGLSFEMLEQR